LVYVGAAVSHHRCVTVVKTGSVFSVEIVLLSGTAKIERLNLE